MKITFDVKNQILTRTDRSQIIANSSDYLEADITFSSEWASMEKTMTFKNGNLVYTYVLTNDKVSQENHLNLGVGTWKVSIIGVAGDQKVITNECNLSVNASGWIGAADTPSESVFEQLLVILQSLHTEAASTAVVRSAVAQYIADHYDELVKEAVIVGDVQAAVDELVQDGIIGDIVASEMPPYAEAAASAQVADWLEDNVDPDTGYVIDNTFTTALAAADAKETGRIKKEFEQFSITGEMNLQGDWVRGYSNVSTGVIENINYRVTHANWLKFSQDVTIFLASDSYSYNAFDSNFNLLTGTTIDPLTIPAGTAFRINIRKRPETPSTPADVAELSSKIKVKTFIGDMDDRLDACEDNLNICLDAHDVLATNTDLDNVTGIGFYPMGYSSIYTHDPIGTNHRRLLIVFRKASLELFCQIIVDEDSGNIYSRAYAGGAWLDWKSKFDAIQTAVNDNKAVTYSARDVLIDGTDLNNVTAIGFYPIAYASTHGNDPIGKNHRRLLIVLKNANASTNGQIIIDKDTGNIYTRSFAGGGWLDWKSKFDSVLDVIDTEKLRPKNLDTHSHTIAHRGVPYSTPAATKPSYVKAKKMGLLIAEGDVRFTSDNVPILFHDATYTVDGVTHVIANETYAQFMEYDIGAAFSPAFAGTYGLTLSEFLDLCNDLQLYPTIEFKVGTTQQVNDCLAIIDAKRVKVFNYKASVANLKTIIDHDPYASVRLGADDYSDTLRNNLITLLAYGEQKHQVHCIFAYGYGTWTSEQIAACKATGAIMGVSSINSNERLLALTEDVDIIFTENGFNATMYKTINAMAD